MPEVTLYGEKLNVTSEMLDEYSTLMDATDFARMTAEKALETYDVCGRLDRAVKEFPSVRKEFYLVAAKYYLEILRDADVVGYEYSAEDFLTDVETECNAINDVHCDLLAAYMKLQNDKVQAERYREMRKESRGRIIGGGFGIIGALEGMAIAGVVNTLTGAAHSLYNMADGAFSDSDISSKKREIYTAARDWVVKAVFDDVVGMLYFCYSKMGHTPFYSYENKGAQNIKNAIDCGEVPKAKIPREVAKVLYQMPYDDKLYFWAFDLLGDKDGELLEYAKLFDKDYVVHTKNMFGNNASVIYEKYVGNPFYKLFIKAPGMSLSDTAVRMYSTAKEEDNVTSIYVESHPEFAKKRDACLRELRLYDYSFEDDETCSLIYSPNERFYIALTENHVYITHPKYMSTSWQDVKYFVNTTKGIIFKWVDGRVTLPGNEDAKIFVNMVDIFWLKKKCLLGVKDNTQRLNEQRERDSQFRGKIVKEMKELATKLPFPSHVYYYGTGHEDKFRCAIASYATLRKNELPLICYDDTILGGAEDGFLVTTKGIHLHNDGMASGEFFSWSELSTIRTPKEGTIIYFNEKIAHAHGITDKAQPLVDILKQLKAKYLIKQPNMSSSSGSSNDADQLFKDGLYFEERGEYRSALESYKKAAEAGHTYALVKIGIIYHRGGGSSTQFVPQNQEEGLKWDIKAAEAGEKTGMLNAGRAFLYGKGVEKNYIVARKWLLKASEAGVEDKDIAVEIGSTYRKKDDASELFKWNLKAANAGDVIGMSNVGYSYMDGMGVEKDYNQAMHWLILASNRGDKPAMSYIGRICENGWGFEQDYGKAMQWYQQAGDNEAIQNLQKRIEREKNGKGNDGCFVTSAVCESFHKPDDCYELTAFRSFRDDWLVYQPDGDALIQEYYKIAPAIVRKINQCKNAKEIYKSIWEKHLSVCLEYIKSNDNARCKEKYVMMVEELRHKFNDS